MTAFTITRRRLMQSAMIGLVCHRAWAGSRCGEPQTPDNNQPLGPFNAASTAEEVTAGLDLTGKTALVTGCSSGLGLETMRVLALRGAHVIGTARTQEKANDACQTVSGKTTPIKLELTEFDSIHECASIVKSFDTPIDILVCNAGVMAIKELRIVNGVEMQFAVNHLGHFMLVNLLTDTVTRAKNGRIVILSSCAHHGAAPHGIDFDNLDGSKSYSPWDAYRRSKLANGLHAMELARRLKSTSATANAVHPGTIKTDLWRHLDRPAPDGKMNKSIPQGAATQCYVGAHPIPAGISGQYFADCNPVIANPIMYDKKMAKRLWVISEELCT